MKKETEKKIEKWLNKFTIGFVIFTIGVQIRIWQGRRLEREENNIQLNSLQSLQIVATAYSPERKQCDNDPYITATNKKVKEGGIAISRPLEKILPLGSWVFIEDKFYQVNDRMSPKWQDYRVDIFCWNKNNAKTFGKKKIVIYYKKL